MTRICLHRIIVAVVGTNQSSGDRIVMYSTTRSFSLLARFSEIRTALGDCCAGRKTEIERARVCLCARWTGWLYSGSKSCARHVAATGLSPRNSALDCGMPRSGRRWCRIPGDRVPGCVASVCRLGVSPRCVASVCRVGVSPRSVPWVCETVTIYY
jgi:hypothetical protein